MNVKAEYDKNPECLCTLGEKFLQNLIEPTVKYDKDHSLGSGEDFNCTSSVLDRTRSSFETYLKHTSCDFTTLSVAKSIIQSFKECSDLCGIHRRPESSSDIPKEENKPRGELLGLRAQEH